MPRINVWYPGQIIKAIHAISKQFSNTFLVIFYLGLPQKQNLKVFVLESRGWLQGRCVLVKLLSNLHLCSTGVVLAQDRTHIKLRSVELLQSWSLWWHQEPRESESSKLAHKRFPILVSCKQRYLFCREHHQNVFICLYSCCLSGPSPKHQSLSTLSKIMGQVPNLSPLKIIKQVTSFGW